MSNENKKINSIGSTNLYYNMANVSEKSTKLKDCIKYNFVNINKKMVFY